MRRSRTGEGISGLGVILLVLLIRGLGGIVDVHGGDVVGQRQDEDCGDEDLDDPEGDEDALQEPRPSIWQGCRHGRTGARRWMDQEWLLAWGQIVFARRRVGPGVSALVSWLGPSDATYATE